MSTTSRQPYPGERWLPAVGFAGRYEISDYGRLWVLYATPKFPHGRIMATNINSEGYKVVHLRNLGGPWIQKKIHTLVLDAFVGLRPKGTLCRHLDGDSLNNHLSNLRWGTHSENAADSRRHGRLPVGERSGTAKLTWDDVRDIRRRSKDGERTAALAAWFEVHPSTIARVVSGARWQECPA